MATTKQTFAVGQRVKFDTHQGARGYGHVQEVTSTVRGAFYAVKCEVSGLVRKIRGAYLTRAPAK